MKTATRSAFPAPRRSSGASLGFFGFLGVLALAAILVVVSAIISGAGIYWGLEAIEGDSGWTNPLQYWTCVKIALAAGVAGLPTAIGKFSNK